MKRAAERDLSKDDVDNSASENEETSELKFREKPLKLTAGATQPAGAGTNVFANVFATKSEATPASTEFKFAFNPAPVKPVTPAEKDHAVAEEPAKKDDSGSNRDVAVTEKVEGSPKKKEKEEDAPKKKDEDEGAPKKEEEKKATEEVKKPAFAFDFKFPTPSTSGFSFGATTTATTTTAAAEGSNGFGTFGGFKPFAFGNLAFPAANANANKDDEEEGEENPEAEVAVGSGTEVASIKVEKKETQTGEEEEETLHKIHAKLFVFAEVEVKKEDGKVTKKEKKFRELGAGEIHVNKHKKSGKVRMLMRADKTLKLLLNVLLFPTLNASISEEKTVRFAAIPSKDTVFEGMDEAKLSMYALKLKHPEDASALLKVIDRNKK
eukprot:ANDGO_02071.mRNA.1 Ran-specific GTPase-activating protein 1